MGETFGFLQKLLKDTTKIPFFRIEYSQTGLMRFLQENTGYILDANFLENTALWQEFFHTKAANDTIFAWVAPGEISFLLHRKPVENTCYIFGPVLTRPFSREDVLQALEPMHMPAQLKHDLLFFAGNLPVVESHILYRTGTLVLEHLTDTKHPMRIVQVSIPSPDSLSIPSTYSPEADIIQMRQVETRYEYSMALTEAVRQGNLSLALQLLSSYDPSKQTPIRNTNPLRNAQNYCIVLNTQLRHALEESGIHPYRVDKLSNEIGIEIEQLKSTKQLPKFFQTVLQRYCRLVQEHAYPSLKPLTNLAVTYIKEHLADNLTVKDTAAALTVNANYLSTLFHKDMGMTFIDFVNQERTRQAAALLRHTNLQIQQIASVVGYNNTSYFAKQFLRFYGVSPSQYGQ